MVASSVRISIRCNHGVSHLRYYFAWSVRCSFGTLWRRNEITFKHWIEETNRSATIVEDTFEWSYTSWFLFVRIGDQNGARSIVGAASFIFHISSPLVGASKYVRSHRTTQYSRVEKVSRTTVLCDFLQARTIELGRYKTSKNIFVKNASFHLSFVPAETGNTVTLSTRLQSSCFSDLFCLPFIYIVE